MPFKRKTYCFLQFFKVKKYKWKDLLATGIFLFQPIEFILKMTGRLFMMTIMQMSDYFLFKWATMNSLRENFNYFCNNK